MEVRLRQEPHHVLLAALYGRLSCAARERESLNPELDHLPAETLCDLLNALERAREAAPQLTESTTWAPKELTRAPAEIELPPSDLVPCSSPPGSRLSIAGMRVEDGSELPAHSPKAPAVYLREDGKLTVNPGAVDSRPFVGRLENLTHQEFDGSLLGDLVFFSLHSAGTVPADPAALASTRKTEGEGTSGEPTNELCAKEGCWHPKSDHAGPCSRCHCEHYGAPGLAPIASPSLDEQLDAVDSELMKQGLPPRPKKVVKPPALTQGEIFMRLGKDAQAKRWARALVDHQTSAYYWRTSSTTGREVRQRVAKEHGPELDEKLFLAVGGQKAKKGRDKPLSWEKLEQYVRLVPTEETAQDRQLGGDA